ncbi:nuclear transport factor 2 family protein [Streptomyces sp. NWU339]|uniref:nuclear transport factor 2 family protein n=1 Tax=Streptomyces sp. NWU339 TaxID=2185284 RepID=UPI000D67E799|nr:nuclear transport factor 2 family protein [Streptomyces sp. NWU339]PWI12117.1 nuclear transport factor 2 family protein [Streptomyces sp. NWU339]
MVTLPAGPTALAAHDWELFAGLFTDDVVLEIAESSSGVGTKTQLLTALRKRLNSAISVHHGHMPEIEITSETTATDVWAMFDSVTPPAGSEYPVLTGFGHHHEECRLKGGQWRISRLEPTRIKRETTPPHEHSRW